MAADNKKRSKRFKRFLGILLVTAVISSFVIPLTLFTVETDASNSDVFYLNDKYGHEVKYEITSSNEVMYIGFESGSYSTEWKNYIPNYVNDPIYGKVYRVTSINARGLVSSIELAPYNPYFKTDNNRKVLMNYDGTELLGMCSKGWSSSFFSIPDSVKVIKKGSINLPSNIKTVTIPDSVEVIEKYSFYNQYYLQTVRIGNGVKEISDYAFSSCDELDSVYFGKNVKTIGVCAFSQCTNLKTITIPSSVKSIESRAFSDCTSLKKVTIEGNPYISKTAFENTPSGVDGQLGEDRERILIIAAIVGISIAVVIALVVVIIKVQKKKKVNRKE